MKKHDINLIAAWAKDWGIKGYDHLDPKVREQNRISEFRKNREKEQREEKPRGPRKY